MGKTKGAFSEGASLKDKKSFAPFLAEDEELILATGYGANYVRHRLIYYIMFPGVIFILLGLAWSYFTGVNLGYGLLAGFFMALIIAILKSFWLYHAHRYLLTTRRVIIKNGFFSVKLTSALYDKITHIEVDQSLMDRLVMKHGNVIVNTAGMNKGEIKIEFVDEPMGFKNLLERLINRERESYGRPTGPVVAVEGELVE
jgi:uncharacterized membrane protein YdbT with pleckstrin-like domain